MSTKKVSINIQEIKENPQKFGKNVDLKVLEALIKKANNHYYNTSQPLFSDSVYDILQDELISRNPESKVLKEVGSEIIDTTNKIELPYYMGSMTKKKDKKSIQNWLKDYKGDYVISDKLDGASALVIYENDTIKMFTRGNGSVGRDISILSKFINIPQLIKFDKKIVLRGELIVSTENFKKYQKVYSNSRAMVNGLMGLKKSDTKMSDIDFVGFEIIEPVLKSSEQYKLMKQLGFKIPNITYTNFNKLNSWGIDLKSLNQTEGSYLLNTLIKHREKSDYDIDGIIVTDNNIYERVKSGNPKHSIAFKSNDMGKITEVIDVKWNISKHGYLIPTVYVEPIDLGTNVKCATGFNGKFICDNKINVGSRVRVVRSGDVIPYISEIISQSEDSLMPNCEYKWNKTGVHILVNSDDNDELNRKQILSFFRTLKVQNFSVGLINRLIDSNYNTIEKISKITKEQLLEQEGIKETLANKIFNNIHKIIDNEIDLAVLMTASLCFKHGFGEKKFQSIINVYPNIMTIENLTSEMITDIDGFSQITANQFIDNFQLFKEFLNKHGYLKYKVKKDEIKVKKGNMFDNKVIVLTGFRDEKINNFIEENGGVISNTFSKLKENILICKTKENESGKLKQANLLMIPIYTKDEFIEKHLINT